MINLLDSAFTSFQLKIKAAFHIRWENSSLNKQGNYFRVTILIVFYHCIIHVVI